jgi:hypothetical protein
MLNPVVLPLPLALAVVAALALAAYAYRRWLEDTPNPWAGQPWAEKAPRRARSSPSPGRHRMTRAIAADPNRRDWAAIAAERIDEAHRRASLVVADWRQPLTDFERRIGVIEIAGLPDRSPVDPGPLHVTGDIDTHELATIA